MSFDPIYKNERYINFLNESNRIESIVEINYADERWQGIRAGHFGALVESQEAAKKSELLSIKDIKRWQKYITEEQRPFGHHIEDEEVGHIRGPNVQKNVRVGDHIPPTWEKVPMLLSCLIEDINKELALVKEKRGIDDPHFCKLLGESFQQFESIHPFADGNGRVGRLLANYIATFCGRTIIVFNSEKTQRNIYYKAHTSKAQMCAFMADKIKEAVFGLKGELLLKFKESEVDPTVYYKSKDDQTKLAYRWHSLEGIYDAAKHEGSQLVERKE